MYCNFISDSEKLPIREHLHTDGDGRIGTRRPVYHNFGSTGVNLEFDIDSGIRLIFGS